LKFLLGSVSWSVYRNYVKTGGTCLFAVVAFMFSVALSSHAGGDYWISVWTTHKIRYVFHLLIGSPVTHVSINSNWSDERYVEIYAGFGVLELILQSAASFSLVGFGVRAATILHKRMVRSLGNAKIGFFDAYVAFVIFLKFCIPLD
jgi:hypothetical protein